VSSLYHHCAASRNERVKRIIADAAKKSAAAVAKTPTAGGYPLWSDNNYCYILSGASVATRVRFTKII
jgi:hypothetical protein